MEVVEKPKIESHLKCKSCTQIFDTTLKLPHMLSCGHTICLACCLSLYANKKIKCPYCLEQLRYESSRDIPMNIFVRDLIKAEYT